jgi:hypothetical protein
VLQDLRRALTVTRPDVEPGDIAADVRALGDAWFGDGDRVALADLVPDAVLRARAAGGAAVVGSACVIAGSLARRLGEPDLQWIAGHRALEAAADEISDAWARYRLALRALQIGDTDEARARPDPAGPVPAAIAAVRDSDRASADDLLAEALAAAADALSCWPRSACSTACRPGSASVPPMPNASSNGRSGNACPNSSPAPR